MAEHSYDFGELAFGIRSTSEAFSDALDEILSEYRTSEETNPYLSVVVPEPEPASRSRKYHILYRDRTRVCKTRNLGALADSLFAELEGPGLAERDDFIILNAGVLGINGTTALTSTELISFVSELGRVVERSRLILPRESFVAIDPESGQIVPLPRSVRIPPGARDRIASLAPPNDEPLRLGLEQPRRVDLVLGEYAAQEGEESPPARPGRSVGFAVADLAWMAVNTRVLGVAVLEGLAALVQGAKTYELRQDRARPMLEAMASVLRAG